MLRALAKNWRSFGLRNPSRFAFCNNTFQEDPENNLKIPKPSFLPGFILDKPYFPPQELNMEMGRDQIKLINAIDVDSEIIGIFPKKAERENFHLESASL